MRSDLGDKARLQHIVDSITEIETYVSSSDYQMFSNNSMMQYACVKQLEIIGEAANHLTPSLTNSHPEVKWREIVALRNLLIHEYFGIDTKIIWDIIQMDISDLKSHIIALIESI